MRISVGFGIAVTAMLLSGSMAFSQIPVEVMAGDKMATLDLMFFRFFKNKEGASSGLLYFNRNRASMDYAMTQTSNLPQFGSTNAFSWNPSFMKGLAPVVVCQIFGSGVFPKAGIQYALIRNNLTIFSWLVCETKQKPNLDFFFLARYTPAMTEKLNLFTQLELIAAFPADPSKNQVFTQRLRLGLKRKEFQFGLAADFSQTGRNAFLATTNSGGFLRYEF